MHFMRLGLSSTLIRGVFRQKGIDLKTLLKVDQNKNAYISWFVRTVKNGRKRIKTKTSQAHVFVACAYLEFNLRRNVQFFRFQTF